MNIHKNARLTPQGRLLLVERITEAGWSVVQAAQAAGISVRQSYRWLARYRAEGAAGLVTAARRRTTASTVPLATE
jgi:transposase